METVGQGQQRVFAEGDDDRLVLDAQHRRMNILRPGRQILDRCSLLPLGHGLLVDPVALRQSSQALFTMLYCSTDGLYRVGAPVSDLFHRASFQACEVMPHQMPVLGTGPNRNNGRASGWE